MPGSISFGRVALGNRSPVTLGASGIHTYMYMYIYICKCTHMDICRDMYMRIWHICIYIYTYGCTEFYLDICVCNEHIFINPKTCIRTYTYLVYGLGVQGLWL